MERTATDQIQLRNLRELRARHLTAAIMQEFDRDKETFTLREIQRVLIEAFHRNGAWIETDQTRHEDGKEPRDDKGWTPSERVREHQARMEALLAVPRIFILNDDLTPAKKVDPKL